MVRAPRSRQFSLANWSVTRKVGIVLLLPVLLASAFAVLRISSELGTISELNAATEQARVKRPMFEYGQAAEQLAVAAVTRDPALEQVASRFDQAAADLEQALRVEKPDEGLSKELSAAIAIGRTMRNGLQSATPQTLKDQVGAVGDHIVVATSHNTLDEITIQRDSLQLGVISNAGPVATRQAITLVGAAITGPDENTQSEVVSALGGEFVLVNIYKTLNSSSAPYADEMLQAVADRSEALKTAATNPMAVLDTLRASSDAYARATTTLLDTIDTKLADRTSELRSTVLRDVAIVVTTLLAGLALALAVARSLVVPIRRLRHDALQVAHVDLPNEIEVVRSGGATPEITAIGVHTTEEIGQLARAIDDIHQASLTLASEQARLRMQIGSMFETLSRRSQSLVEQQLTLIEDLEHDEDNSERLQSLFRLDHLATRMRRNGDNLLVLAGTALRRGQLHPVQLSDMLWSAVSQVEDYQRVEIGAVPDGIVAGEPAIDIEHLLAELIDNALRYSPPTTPVTISVARAVDGGYLIEITDRGLGMSVEDLQTTNERLASGGEVTVETARRMGLFVVGRLAKRHSITANLRRTSTMAQQPGITASVHLPGALVAPPLVHRDSRPALEAAPEQPQQRMLVPVPNAPQDEPMLPQDEPMRVGVTRAGLPQRRPAMQVAEQRPSISVPNGRFVDDTAPAPVSRRFDRDDDDQAHTGPFGPPTLISAAAVPTPPSGLARTVDREPPQNGSLDLWAESTSDGFAEPEDYAPQEPAPATLDLPPLPMRARPGAMLGDSGGRGYEPAGGRGYEPAGGRSGVNTAPPPPQAQPQPVTSSRLQPVTDTSPTPIYQRMVSEWLVEPAAARPSGSTWTSPADAGWMAAEDASSPTTSGRTTGGLPIRNPGAQLVPGGLAPAEEEGTRDPDEIRSNLTRHLSGVRSGRADAQHNDGGLA